MGGDSEARPPCMGHEVYYYMGSKVTEGLRCLVIASAVSLDELREEQRGAERSREEQRGAQERETGTGGGAVSVHN